MHIFVSPSKKPCSRRVFLCLKSDVLRIRLQSIWAETVIITRTQQTPPRLFREILTQLEGTKTAKGNCKQELGPLSLPAPN